MRHLRDRIGKLLGARGVANLAVKSGTAFFIKICGAGLSSLMFLALARAMPADAYGQFGFAFSFATFLAVVGSLGMGTLVLRQVPMYLENQQKEHLAGFVQYSFGLVAAGCVLAGILMVLALIAWPGIKYEGYILATAILTPVLGLSEYFASLQRSLGYVTIALAPKEIFWRLSVILLGLAVAIHWLPPLSSAAAIYCCAGSLAFLVFAQAGAVRTTRIGLPKTLEHWDTPLWRKSIPNLWGTSIIVSAAPNITVIVLGFVFTPAETGAFFAAMKIATILNLVLLSSNVVSAPMLARQFHRGDHEEAQRICRLIAIGVGVPTLLVFAVILVFGREVLALFSTTFASAYPVLVVLSLGYAFNALSGPTGVIMNMSGHDRKFLRIVVVTNAASIAALPVMAALAGQIGAAACLSFSLCAWNFWVWAWSRKHLKVDTSFLSLIVRP
jgi:O-antigen/teichoic acid export membrane protein